MSWYVITCNYSYYLEVLCHRNKQISLSTATLIKFLMAILKSFVLHSYCFTLMILQKYSYKSALSSERFVEDTDKIIPLN